MQCTSSQIKLQHTKKNRRTFCAVRHRGIERDRERSANGEKRTSGQNVITINKSVNDSLSLSIWMYVIYIIHLGTFMSYFWGMTWCDPKITSIMTMHQLWNFLLFFFPSLCSFSFWPCFHFVCI